MYYFKISYVMTMFINVISQNTTLKWIYFDESEIHYDHSAAVWWVKRDFFPQLCLSDVMLLGLIQGTAAQVYEQVWYTSSVCLFYTVLSLWNFKITNENISQSWGFIQVYLDTSYPPPQIIICLFLINYITICTTDLYH